MKCWRPPRVSQIPSSARSQFSHSHSSDLDEIHPGVVGDRLGVLVVEVDRVDQLAVDVELELLGRAVSDPDGRRAGVALEVVEHGLLEVGPAVDAVHDLKRAVTAAGRLAEAVGEPAHERLRLLGEAEPQERVEGEGGVADPGVAVVPVALAAELLGKARGRRGHDGARGPVGEQLQRERGAVHRLAPAAAVRAVVEPAPPVLHGVVERLRGLLVGDERRQRTAHPRRLQAEDGALAGGQVELGTDAVVERPQGRLGDQRKVESAAR